MFKIYMVATFDGYEMTNCEYFSTLTQAQDVRANRQAQIIEEQGEFQVDKCIIKEIKVNEEEKTK